MCLSYLDQYDTDDTTDSEHQLDQVENNKKEELIHVPPKKLRKKKRRPSLGIGNHKNHHHGSNDSGRRHHEPSDNNIQENIRKQVELAEERMKHFLSENRFVNNQSNKGGDQGLNMMQINQEMMKKFFEQNAIANLEGVKKSGQDTSRNVTSGHNKQQKDSERPDLKNAERKTVTHEPYFQNTRAADKNGPGLLGQAGMLGQLLGMDKEREKEGYKKHSFNEFLSRKISLHRSLGDPRYPE